MVYTRTVICGDGVTWLQMSRPLRATSILTSLPDVSELGSRDVEAWRAFFVNAARACIDAIPDDGVAMFFQTDIHHDGTWIDKAKLVQDAAQGGGASQLWHKIVLRAPPATTTWKRPSYSHLLCFSRGVRVDLDHRTPDVIDNGKALWSHGIGVPACAFAIRQIQLLSPTTTTVADPFCGKGTALAVANALGLQAIGVERNKKRAEASRVLSVVL